MPLVIHYSDAPGHVETWGTPELTTVVGLTTKADQGTVGSSKVDLPDSAGTHETAGLRRIYMGESDSPALSNLVFDGYLGQRDYARGKAVSNLGAARTVTVNLVDLNNLLSTKLIVGAKDAAHGDRPRETDVQRIQWLMASSYVGSINDFGLVSTAHPVYMDAADLRNQNAGSVLRDCGLKALKQWFLYYDETQPTVNRIGLFYDFESSTAFSSTLRISNHPGDADGNITFECDSGQPPVQHRDPSQIITGVNVQYDGDKYVFVTSDSIGLTTRTDFYVREVTMQSSNTKVLATAIELGEQMLRDHDKEEDSATVRILIPSTHVGLIKAGHRISCRFDHFTTEYRGFTWWRINSLTVSQSSQKWYWLDMDMVPIPPIASFLVAFTASGAVQPTDNSTNPWTQAFWSGDIGATSVIACGAGPPQGQGMGIYYRKIVPGESATVLTFKSGGPVAGGGAWVYQVGGIDLNTILSTISVVHSNQFLADGGTVTVSATATAPSTLLGGVAFAKVNYDGGWCATSRADAWGVGGTPGALVIASAGTELVNKSNINDCSGVAPWSWIAHAEGSGALSLSAIANSHGDGSGAYNCGYNVGKGGLLIPTPNTFSIIQSAFGGTTLSGGYYSVVLPAAPI